MKECQLCKTCYTDSVGTCPKDGMPTMHTIAGEPVLEGKYNLECRLGQGGMGVVYKARHAYLKTQLAIKVILPDLVGNDPQLVTRFRQEALAAAAIRHQNVVAVTDYGVVAGQLPFLVMEYVEGESLHDLLAREKRLTPERALELMSAICAGVGAAHHQGIVHRDLKPLNIMICSDKPNLSQAVKILDFGLAKIKSGELLGSFIQAQTTGLMGSPYYMAPEQWADDEPDARSDIYSLGVMLYQMLAGDVPFKGSSIPAIMKKHISDPAPTFADVGVAMPPQVETAVLHTLAKNKEQRTASVEAMIRELREAIYPQSIGIHTTSSGMAVSSLNVFTRPPQSRVFVDNVPVGETRVDGWITLNGMQSGNHHLKVSKDGFQDWHSDIVCDGKPQQVVAELQSGGVPSATVAYNTPSRLSTTQDVAAGMHKTSVQKWDTGPRIGVESRPPKKGIFSPWILGSAGLILLFVLGGVGIGAAYMLGIFGGRTGTIANNTTPTPSVTPIVGSTPNMAAIPGGTFVMGRNDGPENERMEHEQTVAAFQMDKTEVTNAEFFEFMSEMKYQPANAKDFLLRWENNRPRPGEEKMPVRYVNHEDATAFAAWRSKRDGVTYRLPTEQEWEYAARNGAKKYLYPWSNEFDPGCAFVDRDNDDPTVVATKSCPNDWGVHDLIGNVVEWTSSEPKEYPGSPGYFEPGAGKSYIVRGGSARYQSKGKNAATSTYRISSLAVNRHPALGFRLARDN